LSELLERGLVYVPPQRLAAQQLAELKEQTAQLKFFNQDLAFQLTDRISAGVAQAFAPMTHSLDSLNTNMASVTQGIGAGAREAIERVSGDQLRGLGDMIAALGEQLNGISTAVGESGGEAARQIREAGEDFRLAARDIRGAFETLTGRISQIGVSISEQGEKAKDAQNEVLERMLRGLEDAQTRSAEAMAEAVTLLKATAASATETFKTKVDETIRDGVDAGGERLKFALEESGEAFRGAATGLARAVETAAGQIDRASEGFMRGGAGASNAATALETITGQARSLAQAMGEAATGFTRAAAPVTEASRAFQEAAARTQGAVEAARDAQLRAVTELNALAIGIRQTQAAAEKAWIDYQTRFEGVDRALENTLRNLAGSLSESMNTFIDFARKFDQELGSGLSKLGGSFDNIQEYADRMEDYAIALRSHVERGGR
jgi:hypothetical protein